MQRLKATKTSLYKLVSEYEVLPLMKRTVFTKAPWQADYWLEWRTRDGLWCKAYLASGLGNALLSIEKKETGGQQVSRTVHGLSCAELRARGMVEEFTTMEERRRMGKVRTA